MLILKLLQKIYLIWGDDDKLLPVEFAHNLKE